MNTPMSKGIVIQKIPKDFIDRIQQWTEYNKLGDWFDFSDLGERGYEVSSSLKFDQGLADKKTQKFIISPTSFTTFIHEVAHINKKLPEGFDGECGSFLFQALLGGNYTQIKQIFSNSANYKKQEKDSSNLFLELSLVTGNKTLDLVDGIENVENIVDVISNLEQRLRDFKQDSFKYIDPIEYLVDCHCLSEKVAQYLIKTTGDDKRSIVSSISDTKKRVIGSFKALTSFYFINLGYTLEDAIGQTEDHFSKNKALSMEKIVGTGISDIFSKLIEYGYPNEFAQKIAANVLEQEPYFAGLQGKNIPLLLDFCANHGPNGHKLLGAILKQPKMLEALIWGSEVETLILIYKNRPELASKIVQNLAGLPWHHDCNNGSYTGSLRSISDDTLRKSGHLDTEYIAHQIALKYFYHTADRSKFLEGINMYSGDIWTTFDIFFQDSTKYRNFMDKRDNRKKVEAYIQGLKRANVKNSQIEQSAKILSKNPILQIEG